MIKTKTQKEQEKRNARFVGYIVLWVILFVLELAFGLQFEVFKHIIPEIVFPIIAATSLCVLFALQSMFWHRVVLKQERESIKWARRIYGVVFGLVIVAVHFFYFQNFWHFVAAIVVAITTSVALIVTTEK